MKQHFDSTDGFCKGLWPQPVGVMGFVHKSKGAKGLSFDIRGNHNFARAFSIGDVAACAGNLGTVHSSLLNENWG